MPYVRPYFRKRVDPIKPADVIVYLDDDGNAVAVDKKGQLIAGPDSDHASVIQSAIDYVSGFNSPSISIIGKFNIKSDIDLSPFANKYFVFDALRAEFIADTATPPSYIIKIHGNTNQLLSGTILVGKINGNNVASGVYMRHANDLYIHINRIEKSNNGLDIDETGTPTYGTFNNIIVVNSIIDCGNGIRIRGNIGTAVGAQGNTFIIGQIISCTTAILIGISDTAADNTWYNKFFIGVIEQCANGIYDRSGKNIFIVNNANNNTYGDFISTTYTYKDLVIIYPESGFGGTAPSSHKIISLNDAIKTESFGTTTITGDGTTTVFEARVQHGLVSDKVSVSVSSTRPTTAPPSYIFAYLEDSDGDGFKETIVITVKFDTAPAAGETVELYWHAQVVG